MCGGDLILGTDVISKLDMGGNFKMDKFKIGQCVWEVVTYNDKNLRLSPLSPHARGFAKSDGYLREMSTRALAMLILREGPEDDCEGQKVAKSKQDRMSNILPIFGESISEVGDTISNLLSRAINMFSSGVNFGVIWKKLRNYCRYLQIRRK